MKKLLAFTLLLLVCITGTFANGVAYYRNDNPSSVCILQLFDGGSWATWQCNDRPAVTYSYHTTRFAMDGTSMYYYSGGEGFELAIMPPFLYVGLIPVRNPNGIIMFTRKGAVTTPPPPTRPPLTPQQIWNDYCDPMDRDLVTGRCPYGGTSGGGYDVSSCLKAAENAERTANMMDDGVSKTMLLQNAIAARSRCLSR